MKKFDDKLEKAASISAETDPKQQVTELDANRRRLIRGAVTVAPLVMTLRSGAVLANSSCSNATIIGDGTILDTGNNKFVPNPGHETITPGDLCYGPLTKADAIALCEGVSGNIPKAGSPPDYFDYGNITVTGSNLRCEGGNSVMQNTDVIIVGASANISLL